MNAACENCFVSPIANLIKAHLSEERDGIIAAHAFNIFCIGRPFEIEPLTNYHRSLGNISILLRTQASLSLNSKMQDASLLC